MAAIIATSDSRFPASLAARLGEQTPQHLTLLGDPALLARPALGLCAGTACPEAVVHQLVQLAQQASDEAIPIISGFQTTAERAWMQVALQRSAAIVIPGQTIDLPKLSPQWRDHIQAGRLLVVQPFIHQPLGQYLAVAALCRALMLFSDGHDGPPEQLARAARLWPVPLLTLAHPTCHGLAQLGAAALAPGDLGNWWGLRFTDQMIAAEETTSARQD